MERNKLPLGIALSHPQSPVPFDHSRARYDDTHTATARRLSRRFGLTDTQARLIASLHFGGASE